MKFQLHIPNVIKVLNAKGMTGQMALGDEMKTLDTPKPSTIRLKSDSIEQ